MEDRELEITADLAQLELSDEEKIRLNSAVDQMLTYFAMMDDLQIETDGAGNRSASKTVSIRKDEIEASDLADDILEQAPDLEDRLISIPNVL